MKTTRTEKVVSALLMGAVLLVAANAWLAFHAEQVLETSEFWVAHTWEVIAGLEHALGLVKDAETGARGYLITGEETDLAARREAARQLPGELQHLQALVSDNPPQEARMVAMAALATRRMDRIASTIEARRTQGQAAAFAIVREGSGTADMNTLRDRVAQLQQTERGLLTRRLVASARARSQARATVTFASVLDIAFILLTLGSLDYERRLRLKASLTARRLEKLQAISDVGLTQLNVAELTDEMLVRLRTLADIDAVALCGWHETEIDIRAVNGVALEPGTRLPVGPGDPLLESVRTNHAVRLHGRDVDRLAITAFPGEMRSILILPLSVSSQVIGLIVAGRKPENAFRDKDDELLPVVADRIALALDRASLYEAERAARQLAETSAALAEASAAEVQLLNAELEDRVRRRTSELEATNSELEAFSYSVSHDLRAPLRSVDGFSVALEEDFGDLLTGEGKHYLARIRAGVQRMGQLIDALLQLSRITRAELVVESVDLSALALEVAHELESQHAQRSIEFVIQPHLEVNGDPRLLRAVLENMLGNAVKFTAKAMQPRIEVGYNPARAAYFIRDNGAGFDQQYAKKLFVAFQRLHGEKDFQGSGIGLATAARVIRRHHGTMGAEGAVGIGATFWFTLGAEP